MLDRALLTWNRNNGVIQKWDFESGFRQFLEAKIERKYLVMEGERCAISRDSTTFVLWDGDAKRLRVWDVNSSEKVLDEYLAFPKPSSAKSFDRFSSRMRVAVADDGSRVAVAPSGAPVAIKATRD
jgi:hypothetical protein